MEFLGKLGIDYKLIIAQIINFGLLLWLLKKFLYQRIVKRIEKDEAELKQAETEKRLLEKEKNFFAKEQERILQETREKAKKIIGEAEEMAGKIQERTREKTTKDAQSYTKLAQNKIALEKFALEKKIITQIKENTKANFKNFFPTILPKGAGPLLTELFFNQLIDQLTDLQLENETKLKEAMEDWEKSQSLPHTKKNQKSLEEFLISKIGQPVIYYVDPLTEKQKRKLEDLIEEKSGFKLPILEKKDRDLMLGFRLELAGFVLESNLWQIINHGFKQTGKN